ncbi:MAG: beta-ketoacyl-ACP synthase III [Planctomycetota bacterium]|jgi:3-oxoacyl-[acyl-carrier-protein] synthase-3
MGGPRKVEIAGTGSYVPEKVLSNRDLEKIVDTSDEWILQRTGMKERRIVTENQTTSDLAAQAGLRALEAADMRPEDVDLILCATCTPDYILPATACMAQEKMHAVNAGGYDVLAACTGFVAAFISGWAYVASGLFDNVLVIGAECLTRIVDYSDRNTCVLFGDAAGAVLLRPGTNGRGVHMLQWGLEADGRGDDLMIIPAGGAVKPTTMDTVEKGDHFLKLKGREVFKMAVPKFADLIQKAMDEAGLTADEVKLVVPHQVNIRIIDAFMKRIDFPPEKIYVNLDRYGNTAAASIPLAFDEAVRKGRLSRGDAVIFVAFGGGLTWGSCVFRF